MLYVYLLSLSNNVHHLKQNTIHRISMYLRLLKSSTTTTITTIITTAAPAPAPAGTTILPPLSVCPAVADSVFPWAVCVDVAKLKLKRIVY